MAACCAAFLLPSVCFCLRNLSVGKDMNTGILAVMAHVISAGVCIGNGIHAIEQYLSVCSMFGHIAVACLIGITLFYIVLRLILHTSLCICCVRVLYGSTQLTDISLIQDII